MKGAIEMENKILEVRDSCTFIPVLAILMKPENDIESYYLNRSGYSPNQNLVIVIRLDDNKCANSPYDWGNMSRTMPIAHNYIEKHWNELKTGDVVCVEYILGERKTPKISEREMIQ